MVRYFWKGSSYKCLHEAMLEDKKKPLEKRR
jgi:hypothetical protein